MSKREDVERLLHAVSDASAIDVDGTPEYCERPPDHEGRCGYLVNTDERMAAMLDGQCRKRVEG